MLEVECNRLPHWDFFSVIFNVVRPYLLIQTRVMRIYSIWICIYPVKSESSTRKFQMTNEPWHESSNNVVCSTSKASDQPAHTEPLLVTWIFYDKYTYNLETISSLRPSITPWCHSFVALLPVTEKEIPLTKRVIRDIDPYQTSN